MVRDLVGGLSNGLAWLSFFFGPVLKNESGAGDRCNDNQLMG